MLGIFYFFLMILPLLAQLLFGTMAIYKVIPVKFKILSQVNFILQIVFAILSFYIGSYNISKYFDQHPNTTRCGMPLLALIMFSILLVIGFVVILAIQYLIKMYREKYKSQLQ